VEAKALTASRTLLDRDRLRIAGALAGRDATVAELAESLDLPARGIGRHLEKLHDAGLVRMESGPNGIRHSLDRGRLAEVAAELSRLEQSLQQATSGLPVPGDANAAEGSSAEDGRILRAFFEDGRLTSIPAQHAKRTVILRFLAATAFAPGEEYPEKEVNMRLALRHPDVAALRRYLVDEGFMERSAGIYRVKDATGR
jgi:DNA-binding transcriptional ArsR family regulator